MTCMTPRFIIINFCVCVQKHSIICNASKKSPFEKTADLAARRLYSQTILAAIDICSILQAFSIAKVFTRGTLVYGLKV